MSYAWNGLDGYEVFCVSEEQVKVDLKKRECSCRLWKLIGIPCIHAIPPIYSRKQLPADWVDNCYKVETFGWLYENAEHEAYLINLHNWMNEMGFLLHNFQANPILICSQPNPTTVELMGRMTRAKRAKGVNMSQDA
ncbi:hypothetical protein LIER_19660 [Lithospermum erythrorhizon]|uniref:SWIM-type domain-containing protein n=1 Tax=Lithospermum erythrorhizon TaxID=34254 RepID=A0AAV3QJG5_LITER